MPQEIYFLTVRFPAWDARNKASYMDPDEAPESQVYPFYEVDHVLIAEQLLELFSVNYFDVNADSDYMEQRFDIVCAASLDVSQRILWRGRISKLQDAPCDEWNRNALDKALRNIHKKAQDWEPLIKDELANDIYPDRPENLIPPLPPNTKETTETQLSTGQDGPGNAGGETSDNLQDWLWRLDCIQEELEKLLAETNVRIFFSPKPDAYSDPPLTTFPFGGAVLQREVVCKKYEDAKKGLLWLDFSRDLLGPLVLRTTDYSFDGVVHSSIPEDCSSPETASWFVWYQAGVSGEKMEAGLWGDIHGGLQKTEAAILEACATETGAVKKIVPAGGYYWTLNVWPMTLLHMALGHIHPLIDCGQIKCAPHWRAHLSDGAVLLRPDYCTATRYALDYLRHIAKTAQDGDEGEAVTLTADNRSDGPQAKQHNKPTVAAAQETVPETDWHDVQNRLLNLYKSGEAYTSQRELANRLRCSESTINKAVNDSAKLKGWMKRRARGTPKAQSLNPVVMDIARSNVDDPADVLTDDDVDSAFARLLEEAKPQERAKLNELDAGGRRKMANLYLKQQAERHIEDDARKGNRILGRRP